VGWLDDTHDYPRGEVSDDFMEKLLQLLANPWQPCVALGFHACELCGPMVVNEGGVIDHALGTRNLFVPSEDCIYVAPELVVHYIEVHGYQPPEKFVDAVLRCPRMGSTAYSEALQRIGGVAFSRGMRGRPTVFSVLYNLLPIPFRWKRKIFGRWLASGRL
jgi:hypothetical protein